MTKTIRLIAGLIFIVFSVVANAEDSYRYEAGVMYSDTDYDSGLGYTTILGAAQILLDPVSYKNGPYAEASFFDRHSSFIVGLGMQEFEIGAVDIDGTATALAFEFAQPDSPFVLGASYTSLDAEETVAGIFLDFEVAELVISAGFHLNEHSRVTLSFTDSELDIYAPALSLGGTIESDTVGVGYKSVLTLAGSNYVNVEAGYSQTDTEGFDSDEIRFGADYYLNKMTSIGAELAFLSSDDSTEEGEEITIRFRHFADKFTSFGIEFQNFKADVADNDYDTVSFQFLHRFN